MPLFPHHTNFSSNEVTPSFPNKLCITPTLNKRITEIATTYLSSASHKGKLFRVNTLGQICVDDKVVFDVPYELEEFLAGSTNTDGAGNGDYDLWFSWNGQLLQAGFAGSSALGYTPELESVDYNSLTLTVSGVEAVYNTIITRSTNGYLADSIRLRNGILPIDRTIVCNKIAPNTWSNTYPVTPNVLEDLYNDINGGGGLLAVYTINALNYRVTHSNGLFTVGISGIGTESYSDRIFKSVGPLNTANPNLWTEIRLNPYSDPSGYDQWCKNGTSVLTVT